MKLTLRSVRDETDDVRSFLFVPDTPVSYEPGQHISIMLPIDQPDARGRERMFTVSSSPTEGMIMMTTKRGVSSFKRALFSLPVGTAVEARGPGGLFFLKTDVPGPHVFIAGGIGVTPFRSMIKYAVDHRLNQRMILFYSARTEKDFVFRKELDAWASRTSVLSLRYTITQPHRSDRPWTGHVGRITDAFIGDHVEDRRHGMFYICGPGGMVDDTIAILGTLGITHCSILFEKFPGYGSS